MTAIDEERLLRGYPGRMLFTVSFGFLTLQAGRLVLPPMLPSIIDDFAINEFTAGVALSVMWGAYALCQYASGRLSDRLTRKTVLVTAMAVMGVGLLVVVGAPVYLVFVLGVTVAGLGAGLYPTAGYAFVSELYVARRGQAIGLYTAAADVGGVVASGLAVAALSVGVWQAAFVPLVAAIGAIVVALHVWNHQRYRVERVELRPWPTVVRLLGDAKIALVVLSYSFYMFTWQGLASFLPAYLQAEKSFRPATASVAFATLFLVGAVAKPTAGWLSDRVPRLLVIVGALGLGAVSLLGLMVAGTVALSFGAVAVFAVGLLAVPPVMQAYLLDLLPDVSRGGDLGAIRTVYMVLGATSPGVLGFVIEELNYAVAFSGLVVCMALSGACVVATIRID